MSEHQPSTGDVPADDSTYSVATTGRVAIEVESIDTYFYALSNRPVVRRITVTNVDVPDDGQDIVITVSAESPAAVALLHPYAIAVPSFPARDEKVLTGVRLTPNHRALALLDELVSGEIVVTATHDGNLVGEARAPITFLAFNQWMYREQFYDALAAFVQPNNEVISPVLTRASQLLGERTGSDATEGYQSGDPSRVRETAKAVYDALAELELRYTDPPASFEGYGQKVRTPEIVLQERAATCLDSSVLYASCLLALGLEAHIVLVTGHAFVAYWQGDRGADVDHVEVERLMRRSVVDNPNEIALLFSALRISPVETTTFTSRSEGKSFEEAAQQDVGYFTSQTHHLHGLVNIAYAREHGVPPIPSQKVLAAAEAGTTEPLVPDRWTPSVVANEASADVSSSPDDAGNRAGDGTPPRVKAWLRSLLDLSFSNPLLRLGGSRGTTGAYRLELAAGLLGTVEDRLMAHGTFDIVTAATASGGLLADPTNVDALGAELNDRGRIFSPALADYESDLSSVKAQLIIEQPDLTPAVLEQVARDVLAAAYEQSLDRSLAGIRRKAREVESQTGANTLFLTIGTLEWTEAATTRSGRDANARAPLFLIPVRVTGKAKTGIRVAAGDAADVIPNYCLLEKLRQTYGIVIDELERPVADDSGIDVDRLIRKVREALSKANIRDASVNEDAYLAVLNFSTFRLWKDMRDHWSTFLESPVVRHLVEHPNESFDSVEPDGTTTPAELRCPIECDQSQLEAVRWSVEGRSFVLEGPPGTGKSQTIANLLAANIAAGKKVLFVAEKQAALEVVRKRLDRAGLGPFCLNLHDKGSKPEQIRGQIRSSLDFQPLDRVSEWNDVHARWAADAAVLSGYRDAIHAENDAGLSAWTARQEAIQIGAGPAFSVPATFIAAARQQVPAVRAALLDLPRVVGDGPVEPAAPWSFARSRSFSTLDIGTINTAIDALGKVLASLAAAPGGAETALRGIEDPAELGTVVLTLDRWHRGELPTDPDLAQVDAPGRAEARDAALSRLDAIVAGQAQVLAAFSPAVYGVDLGPALAAGQDAVAAGLFSRGKKTKAFLAQIQPFLVAAPGEPDELLGLLRSAAGAQRELQDVRATIAALPGANLPDEWSPFDPVQRADLRVRLTALAEDARILLTPTSVDVRRRLADGWAPDLGLVEVLRSGAGWWQVLLHGLDADATSVRRWRRDRPLADAWAAAQEAWTADAPRLLGLQRWCELIDVLEPVRTAGLDGVVDAILDGAVPASDAYERFRRGFVESALHERLEAGRVDLFDGRSHDRRIEDFATNDRHRREIIRDLIPAELVNARPVKGGRRVGKWGALEQELNRKSRRLSIRKLVEEYRDILPDLTPCFLMSPDSVARFVPPGSITFDLVVFDEASQIEVAKSVGAIGRARSVVVVGDTRQMPPSRFGGAGATDPDLDLEADPEDETLYEDLESILSECVESNLPRLYLECHYRSRHEALIAFSNHNFYEDRLTTFPSPAGPDVMPISWRRVDGRFERSAAGEDNRTNRVEADAIVAEIRRRLDDPATSGQSIGVVTLNAPQQSLLLRLLEETGDERIQTLLESDGEEALIVRNLESVQGDERDVIMLSVAFSPTITTADDGTETRGRLPLNFGPLNKKGGERRLNVAVTRARAEVVVFCSFDPEEMRVAEGSSLGLRLLRSYLEGARDGVRRSADLVGRAPTPPDRHRSEIADALRARGLRVAENVGLSSFRIDLAVGRPDEDEWAVAVLLDGPGWASRATVYDRDALPPTVLTNAMGWPVVKRLWFPMWLYARDEALDDIERAVAQAGAVGAPVLADGARPAEATAAEPVAGVTSVSALGTTALDLNSTDQAADPLTQSAPSGPLDTDGSSTTPTHADATDSSAVPAFAVGFSGNRATTLPPVGSSQHAVAPATQQPVLGGRDILDQLADPQSRDLVLQAISECLDDSAPIAAAQLARVVAARFGLERVRQSRADSILALVPGALRRSSNLGEFVWAEHVDPATWTGYRDSESFGSARSIDEIAPEEILNAMVDLVHQGVEMDEEELLRHTAETFGAKRITAGVRDRLTAVVQVGESTGRLARIEDRVRLAT